MAKTRNIRKAAVSTPRRQKRRVSCLTKRILVRAARAGAMAQLPQLFKL
ncbi:MAG: hypothetical protein J7527_18930 [Chitinophagaceae bacterium]|nr:hypothetical protein [Chitinophagaceae bacterium]